MVRQRKSWLPALNHLSILANSLIVLIIACVSVAIFSQNYW
ncbi:hypothetical protein HMPREF0758_4245 [Serratia odorifera DSM 4582]|uniref:Uncharacterized protein n=1 Tax=Serratia odorifera DSM 4582 TaxID=667129 RepID=D4E7U5_SEROD|nr:hypothetical protein HMPREF0758_4245 [Serratia odorifera DSM 4582]